MKLEEEDVKWLSDNFKTINERLQKISQMATEALYAAAINAKVLDPLVDEEAKQQATKDVGEMVGKALAKKVPDTLSPSEAFDKYGGKL